MDNGGSQLGEEWNDPCAVSPETALSGAERTVMSEDYLHYRKKLRLPVLDFTEQSPHARGKQKLVRKGHMASIFYTPPTDEALVYDIKLLKSYGFNTIRKHVKIESDRFYYHCDRMGMIVWQDMPNGGEITTCFL